MIDHYYSHYCGKLQVSLKICLSQVPLENLHPEIIEQLFGHPVAIS